jgi:hypothetical protein
MKPGGGLLKESDEIRLLHLRLSLRPEAELILPALNKGNALRGGFGSAFRRLVCVDLRWECAACALRFDCPYTRVFNPFLPPDADRLTAMQNIPRPFVFKPPLTARTHFGADDALVFELVLVGAAIAYLPYFIVAFRELGAGGFGLNRARVRLAAVDALDRNGAATPVYDAGANLVRSAPPIALDLATGPARPGAEDTLELELLTPTTLRTGSAADRDAVVVRQPHFHHLLKRLRDRLNSLATFYGGGPLGLDFKALGEAAEAVRTVSDQTRWLERSRFSARRRTPHDLSGLAGTIIVRGDLLRFLPLLRAGEYIHVGKNAVFGNGWLAVRAFQPDDR